MPPTQICFVKYRDTDGDGVRDTGEILLPNWQFTLFNNANFVIGGAVTGPSSWPNCFNLAPGTYTLKEIPKPGWYQTQPINLAPHTVTLAAGQIVNIAFGNRQGTPTRVCAIKYHDLNGNHVRDPGEPALPGFSFGLYQGSTLIGSAATDASGNACFTVPPGLYRFLESPMAGWSVTDPASGPPEKFVTAMLGTTVTASFGNRPTTTTTTTIDLRIDTNFSKAVPPKPPGFIFLILPSRPASVPIPAGATLIVNGSLSPAAPFPTMTPPTNWSCTGSWAAFTCTTTLSAATAYPPLEIHTTGSPPPGTTVTYVASVVMAGNTDPVPGNHARTITVTFP